MQIKAKVALSLPNKYYKITLKYDTFQKAMWDQYFIASLVYNTNYESDAHVYINEITGNGSLNQHFKILYDEIIKMEPEQIKGILENSLYPITIVDQKNHFKYYEMFNATRFNNQVFDGNLENDKDLLVKMLLPTRKDVKLLSIDFDIQVGKVVKNIYNIIFSDAEIKVDLDNEQYYQISKENFLSVYEKEDINSDWMPMIGNKITQGNWNVLTKLVADSWGEAKNTYKTKDNNLAVLLPDGIQETSVISAYGLLFYKDVKHSFDIKNQDKFIEAVEFMKTKNYLTEYPQKSLISLLDILPWKNAQEIIELTLQRKKLKGVIEAALKLIIEGLSTGWEKSTLMVIKNQAPKRYYKYLYKLDSDLGFGDTDLLDIDDIDLNQEDKKRKDAYFEKRDNYLKEINQMVGDMTTSGVRENLKKLQKDKLVNSVKKFLNDVQGHNKGGLEKLSLEELAKKYEEIKRVYNGDYAKVKERCDKLGD